jgi:hypothetical protein
MWKTNRLKMMALSSWCGAYRPTPNGLALSRRLEGTTLSDREALLLLLDHKIAPIQPVGSSARLCEKSERWVGGPQKAMCSNF